MKNNAVTKLNELHLVLGGVFWESKRGVPILSIKEKGINISWFGRRDVYRLFENSVESPDGQKRTDFGSVNALKRYIKRL